ncbi:KH domain-containing protein [Planococcus maritimus]|uniref:RNA-binding protein KhpA n=1 Tax=Planococcus maritimus TaxID=192421 RepID=A0A150W7L8_PLAMR|nr:KH domain-containing protein [Planococcus maritimus]ANU17479.1 RNA-binding protein [Planococcus maritimus]KYG58995.1 RNA-binding protein [Planococcus maritimus]OED32699.1 RNA-binding protein [Planococcus maritimus]QMT16321.1 KH domain-containing protein [Planococcus maritimus]
MEQLIETIVKPLVDYPEAVRIEKDENTNRVVYKLSVHPSDTGKVIGKQGRVAKAVRSVVYSAAGNYHKKKTYLDIVD